MNRTAPPPPPRPEWAYFLDVDGTLLDLAEAPSAVTVDTALLDMLERLRRASGGAIALVSGRALSDLDQRLGPWRWIYAGQHGLERRDAAGRLWSAPAAPGVKAAMRRALEPLLARHAGLLLEDKGLTLALHYRRAPALAAYVHRQLGRLVAAAGTGVELQKGKRVVELKPVGVDKGTTVAAYLAEAPFQGRLPVFVGDDVNDEHAFAVVNDRGGVSIKVGAGRTKARYRLPDVAAVRAWLGAMAAP